MSDSSPKEPTSHSSGVEARPTTAESHPPTVETRPTTASSTPATDPFASTLSSRSPSIRISLDQSSSPNGSSAGAGRTQSDYSQPIPYPLQSILNSPKSGSFSFSARSSAVRISNAPAPAKPKAPRMKSHMINSDAPAPKPWNDKPNPRAKIAYFLTYAALMLGLAAGAVQCYFTFKNVALDKQPLCLVMDENFDGTDDSVFGNGGSFFREVNMDGFGNGEFEMTTASTNNSFVQDGMLYIVPTLTSDNLGSDAILDGTIYNITGCTFNITTPNNGFITEGGVTFFDSDSYYRSCSAVSNRTAGSLINPVQSARITTRFSASIKFGRVEIRAKMPTGDWLWPAIWMLPVDSVYGPWPLSGEIDLVESRGNGIEYTNRGSNFVQGSLNWGPTPQLNGVSNSYSWWSQKRRSFGADFHTYALEWTEQFLRIYVDSRLHTLLDLRFNEPFFKRGNFPEVINQGGGLQALQNPWINGTDATPFDQDFYLILNVAVGATNGWFPDFQGNKPWLDRSPNPMADFYNNIKAWYPTWPTTAADRGMVVDYVKMWKHC